MAEGGRVGGWWRGVGEGRRVVWIRAIFGVCSGIVGEVSMVDREPEPVGLSAARNMGSRHEGGPKRSAAQGFEGDSRWWRSKIVWEPLKVLLGAPFSV